MAVETDLDKIYKAFTSTNPVVDWNEHTAVKVKDFTDWRITRWRMYGYTNEELWEDFGIDFA